MITKKVTWKVEDKKTIMVNGRLYKAFKQKCLFEDQTIKGKIEELMELYLEKK